MTQARNDAVGKGAAAIVWLETEEDAPLPTLVWGLKSQEAILRLRHFSIFLDQFLGSTEAFLRPDRGLARAPRADAVKPGRRPPPEAARSGLDGVEHGASMAGSGRLVAT